MRVFLLLILIIPTYAYADIIDGGRGILFGDNHAFAVTAIPDWVLDNQSGVEQGLHMVFYPKGGAWSNSPVIIYGQSIPTSHTPNIKAQVDFTINQFRNNGSPTYIGEEQTPLTLHKGKSAEIYHYSGDQWGNYEAVAYIKEADTINFLVFNSRKKENFVKFIGDFLQIVNSYQNLYKSPKSVSDQLIDNLKRESKSILKNNEAKAYESNAIKTVGQSIANCIQYCSSYYSKDEPLPSFNYLVRIDSDGAINDFNIQPTNTLSVCFSSIMSDVRYPPHKFKTFVLDVKMETEQ